MQLSLAQIEDLWIQNGGSQQTAPTAAAIAYAESNGGDPSALNPNDPIGNGAYQSAFGLFQIANGTHNPFNENWSDPVTNTQAAIAKYNAAGGFSPWGTYKSGAYQQYLSQAYLALPQALQNIGNAITGNSGSTTTQTPTQNSQPSWFPQIFNVPGILQPILGTSPGQAPTNFAQYAPLLVGVGIVLIGLVVVLSNHQTQIISTAKTAAEVAG